MKKALNFLLVIALTAITIISCNKGPDVVPVEGLDTFNDEVTLFSIKYPKNWKKSSVPGARFVVFSHDQVRSRFGRYDPTGFPGAKIDFLVTPLDSVTTIDTVIARAKVFPQNIYEEAETTIDGVTAKKLVFSFPLSGGMFNGMILIATKDNKRASSIFIESFDDSYETYKESFDEIIKSIKLAEMPPERKVDTITQVVEADPPSQTLETRQGDGFTIGIPDNFGAENIGKAASALKSWSFLGKRRGDCFIKIEMFDSKGKALSKIVDELKGSLPGSGGANKTSLGGAEAYRVDYKPAGQVKGRVYFVMKDKHLYRLTINWFVGEEKDFLPVFEKSVASFKLQ